MPDSVHRPVFYVLTCPGRELELAKTLTSWRISDWGALPLAITDQEDKEPASEWGSRKQARRVAAAYKRMLTVALSAPGSEEDWMMFTEDDLHVHPKIGTLFDRWPALHDPRCGLASLFNPALLSVPHWGELARAFPAKPESFSGGQALLLRRRSAAWALQGWDLVDGLPAQRLAKLLGRYGPIWVHRPSLVQIGTDKSSGDSQVAPAADFDPLHEA